MKISGFTFIRNAVKYDYPMVEAIHSIMPLCDEVVVAVGASEDETYELIKSIDNKKIRIIDTEWNDEMREGGRVLAVETDKAYNAISNDTDWAFYIQGDEVIHEQYLPIVRRAMEKHIDDERVDGLLFKYLHFYGSYDYVGTASNWYKHEIRVLRNNAEFYSYRDAQGFRKGNNEKLQVKSIDAYIYHYGWVKPPEAMQRKIVNFNKLWHDDEWIGENIEKVALFDYSSNISELALFKGDHPDVMKQRINNLNWEFAHDISFNKRSIKDRAKGLAKSLLGLDFEYKNYKLID